MFSMSEETAKLVLNAYDNFLTKSDFFIHCLRWLGWLIIRGLAFLVGKLEKVVDSVTFVTDFFDSAGINELIEKFKPVLGLLLVFSIIFIGYQLMLNKKYDRSKLSMNIILALCVVVVLPIAMTNLNKLTKLGMDEVKGNVSMVKQIVSNNVTDLYLLDEKGFPLDDKNNAKDISPKNNMGDNILKIDPNEEVDRGKVSGKNKIIFENELIRNKDGGEELSRINGLFKWDDEYYRFHINFFTIMCTLIITAGVLIFTAVKIVKLSIELAFSKVMTTFVAVGDISGGQKLRQSINGIISIFVSIFATTLMLKLYILATAYFSDKLSPVATIIAMFASAIFVIDGPNYIEKIFGVDAGLSSAWKALTGLNSALDIMNKMGQATSGALEKMKDLGAGALGGLNFAKGMVDGAMNTSLEDEIDNENSKGENDNNSNDTLDNQMENEGDNINEDIDGNDGGINDNTDLDNDINNPNSDEDLSDNQTSLDDDMENEQFNNGDDLNNIDDGEEINQPSLEDDINENADIEGNKELSDTENNINGNNTQSLEDEINSNLDNSSDNSFDENSWSAFDDIAGTSDYGFDDISNDGFTSSVDNISNEPINQDNLGYDNIENNPTGNINDEDIKNTNIQNDIGNDNIENSSSENIDDNIKNKEKTEKENPNIGYKNPIEDRNIFDIKKDNFKNKFNDLDIKLDRSYTIGKNTGRDIRKFINKKRKGDK